MILTIFCGHPQETAYTDKQVKSLEGVIPSLSKIKSLTTFFAYAKDRNQYLEATGNSMLCGSHRKLALDVDLDVRKTKTALELLRC